VPRGSMGLRNGSLASAPAKNPSPHLGEGNIDSMTQLYINGRCRKMVAHRDGANSLQLRYGARCEPSADHSCGHSVRDVPNRLFWGLSRQGPSRSPGSPSSRRTAPLDLLSSTRPPPTCLPAANHFHNKHMILVPAHIKRVILSIIADGGKRAGAPKATRPPSPPNRDPLDLLEGDDLHRPCERRAWPLGEPRGTSGRWGQIGTRL
jgi:hypothetical protein